MTLEEARTAAPWIKIEQRGSTLFDLECTVCKGLESFSSMMMGVGGFYTGSGEDVMKVKAFRFHVLCGEQRRQEAFTARPETPAAPAVKSVGVGGGRMISLTDEESEVS